MVNTLAYRMLRYGVAVFRRYTNQWRVKIDDILQVILKRVAYSSPLFEWGYIFGALGFPVFLT